jgi:hypothetical protein
MAPNVSLDRTRKLLKQGTMDASRQGMGAEYGV